MKPDAVVEALAPPALLRLAAGLSLPASRKEAARALAAAIGVEAIIVFIRDDEVDALLPAAGFPQTLPDSAAWRTFLAECVRHGRADASLPLRAGEFRPSVGHAWERDAVLVLVGTGAGTADVTWLWTLLPLLHATFRAEGVESLARAQATLAHESAARASTLAMMLDKARMQVESALAIARAARVELEEKNSLLQAQAIEMETVNQQLMEQAEAMEAQAIEMELQADELLSTNAALQHSRRMAEAANRAKSDFLATMSHELRTPLNAIAGHAQLLTMGLRGPLNDEQRDALARIDRSQRHLLGLINDILNLSRIEAGQMHYELAEVSLTDALAEVAPMIESQIAAKQLAFDVADLSHLPPVCVDREKLQQILLNLLSNAVKFTESGGRVSVEAVGHAHDAGTVLVTVSDTGRGIPADKLDFIFEPFTQVDASHSRLGQGTGLGLAISRDLARGMGGDLTVRSELGAGSSFTLSLVVGSPPNGTKTGGG